MTAVVRAQNYLREFHHREPREKGRSLTITGKIYNLCVLCGSLLVFRVAGVTFALTALSVVLFGLSATPAHAEDDDPVASGQEALDRSFGSYPWYDSANDDVRRITVKPARSVNPNWFKNWNLPSANIFAWIVITMILAGLIYALVRAFLSHESVASPSRTAAAATMSDADRVESLPFPVRRPDADMLAEAGRHYEQGEFGEAMIYLYSHLLIQLDRHQVIRLAQGKTNRQYVRETSARPPLHEILESAMIVFEETFFGEHTLDRARFESCWSRLDQFHQQVQQGAL